MTYFAFLAVFVGIPILFLGLAAFMDRRRENRLPYHLTAWPFGPVLLAHIAIAVIYTTPWDNYLVATGVWWYDPALVTGFTLGWVPVEEYTFFVLQPIFTGLWLLFLARRITKPTDLGPDTPWVRRWATGITGLGWLAAVIILAVGWQPGTYLGLEVAWAFIPIMVQLAFGADILWHRRRLVALALIPSTLYLAAADAIAIQTGTWTIDPAQSMRILLGDVLPVEEFVFFLLTNTMVIFGITLAINRKSLARFTLDTDAS